MKKVWNMALCLSTALLVSGCWKKSHEDKHAKGHHAKVADHSHDHKQEEKVADNANDTADSGTPSSAEDEEAGPKAEKTSKSDGKSKFMKKLVSFFGKKDAQNKENADYQNTAKVASKDLARSSQEETETM